MKMCKLFILCTLCLTFCIFSWFRMVLTHLKYLSLSFSITSFLFSASRLVFISFALPPNRIRNHNHNRIPLQSLCLLVRYSILAHPRRNWKVCSIWFFLWMLIIIKITIKLYVVYVPCAAHTHTRIQIAISQSRALYAFIPANSQQIPNRSVHAKVLHKSILWFSGKTIFRNVSQSKYERKTNEYIRFFDGKSDWLQTHTREQAGEGEPQRERNIHTQNICKKNKYQDDMLKKSLMFAYLFVSASECE